MKKDLTIEEVEQLKLEAMSGMIKILYDLEHKLECSVNVDVVIVGRDFTGREVKQIKLTIEI